MTPSLVTHDGEHGVAVYAGQLAAAVTAQTGADASAPWSRIDALPEGTPLHLHFTDRLWASSPEAAAQRVLTLALRHPLTVTLHDLPQPSDGERNLPRRASSYGAVVAAARGVVCNSAHEAALLREWTDAAAASVVIPLPVDPAPGRTDFVDVDGSVGVLGFFYPGKGHDEALTAAVAASVERFTVIGRASDGHQDELDAFVRGAARRGVSVEVTGYLDDAELLRRCRRVGVPVVAHVHVSASGSLATWIAAGRRPVAVSNRYTDEVAQLRPGSLTLVDSDGLAGAVAECRTDPLRTWLPAEVPVVHGLADAARAYLTWWQGVPWT